MLHKEKSCGAHLTFCIVTYLTNIKYTNLTFKRIRLFEEGLKSSDKSIKAIFLRN